jgi:hypothetical protein
VHSFCVGVAIIICVCLFVRTLQVLGSGRTALSLAAASGHEGMVRMLLSHRASPLIAAKNFTTPLQLAYRSRNAASAQAIMTAIAQLDAVAVLRQNETAARWLEQGAMPSGSSQRYFLRCV